MVMKMIYRLMIVLPVMVSLMMLSGCGRGYIYDDEWHASGENFPIGALGTNNRIQHWEVIPERQEEAQVLLAKVRYVRLTEQQAREFAGQEIPGLGAPYLIRAVCLWSKDFDVYLVEKGATVVVDQISMGAFATVWRVNRYALIVRLKSAPKKVIPLCGAAV